MIQYFSSVKHGVFFKARIASLRSLSRYYSTSPRHSKLPEFDSKGNIILRSINYVKRVDEYQNEVQKVPESVKIDTLIERIEDRPELLKLLSTFLTELNRIGINQGSRRISSLKYRWYYLTKLRSIHSTFWSSCELLELSSHKHRLEFDPKHLGILDPKNFSKELYTQILRGTYKGKSFMDITLFGHKIY